jgi:antirestriction protein ArdC
MSKAIYDAVTASIISELEKGAAPWIKPWQGSVATGADRNIQSGKAYQGINRLILAISGMRFGSPVWGTYKQWQTLGANVKKGEKGTQIVFFKPSVAGKDKTTGEDITYMLLKGSYVFNVNQVEGIEVTVSEAAPKTELQRNQACEDAIKATGAAISYGGDVACYSPTFDHIRMPHLADFTDANQFYATVFHELTHWTGHKSRCDRNLSGRFGNPDYAFEELVAELGAAFLAQDYGLNGELRHAGYIGHWLKACKEDSKAIFKAAALAQKAADFINGKHIVEVQEDEQLAA